MLISSAQISNQCEVELSIQPGKPYSDAIIRSSFFYTSVHSPKAPIAVQVSNVIRPDETTDAEWHDVGTGKFVPTNMVFKWLRVKLTDQTPITSVNVVSVHPTY